MTDNAELIRWIKRCRDGDEIPSHAVIEHKLNRWFAFTVIDGKQVALAEATGEKFDFATGEMIADPNYTKPPE